MNAVSLTAVSPKPAAIVSATQKEYEPVQSVKRNCDVTLPQSSSPITPASFLTPAKSKSQQYKPGEKIRHNKFGEGIILKSEMEQNTEFVEVQFEGKHGKKRLSMDFAKLEKI